MSERNFLTAVVVLLLPLSFGLDPGPGLKTARETGTNYFLTMNVAPPFDREIQTGKPAARDSAIPIDFAASAIRPGEDTGIFESSFDTNVTQDVTCEAPTDTIDDPAVDRVNENCCCTGDRIESADRPGISFPLDESFSGSDSSEDNRMPIGSVPIRSGRHSSDAPIPTPEPGSLAMLACGLVALAGVARKQMQRKSRQAA